MEDKLKKEDLDIDVVNNKIDMSWEKYLCPSSQLELADAVELVNTRSFCPEADCKEWCFALVESSPDFENWYDGNIDEMPGRFVELNGFFDFPEAFELFKKAELQEGDCLYLQFMPIDLDDPEWGDLTLLERRFVLPEQEVKEDLELDVVDETEDILIIQALSDLIAEEYGKENHLLEREYPEAESGWSSQLYIDRDDNSEYLVCTEEEAEDYAREDLQSLIDDIGPVEYFGYDYCENWINDEYFDDMLREDMEYQVDEMSEDELIDEMESYGIIDEDDMEYDNPDNYEEGDEVEGHYPESLIEDKKEELIQRMVDSYSSGWEWMQEIYSERDLSEFLKEHPEAIDVDGMIDNILRYDGYGNQLASYDGKEHDIHYEDEFGSTHYLYVYRIN